MHNMVLYIHIPKYTNKQNMRNEFDGVQKSASVLTPTTIYIVMVSDSEQCLI